MEIIPAIDIIDGKCVRLEKGDYSKETLYNNDPLEVARKFEDAGIRRLHLVDLDGAKSRHVVNLGVLETIASNTELRIDFGGGLKSEQDLVSVFNAGADQVTLGSIAATDFDKSCDWIEKFGVERIIIGADVSNDKIMISGWQETSGHELFDFLEKYSRIGAKYIICTDISRDGMLTGPPIGLYRRIQSSFPSLKVIASGGVAGINDLHELRSIDVYGAIVGKAIYEKKISLDQIGSLLC